MGEYINLEDFQNGGEVAGTRSEDGKVSLEGLRMVSHSLQHGKAPHGTIVTVRDLINLPKEVSFFIPLVLRLLQHMQRAFLRLAQLAGQNFL